MLIIIIVAAIVLSFFGLNPSVLWNEYAVPAIRWVWEILFSVISFLIEVVVFFVDIFREGGTTTPTE